MSLPDRRTYWTEQMDAAFAFMEAMARYPVAECREPFASLPQRAKDRGVEILFSNTLINRHFPRVYFLRDSLADTLCKAAESFSRRGWTLKIEDGYRSPEMQRGQIHNPAHFDLILQKVIWETGCRTPDPALAALMMRRVSAMIASRCRVGTHISGSAVDISLIDRRTGEEIDRSHPYLEFSERTPMASPFITPEQRRHREEITAVMLEHDWHAYPYEYWHYSSGDCYAEHLADSGQPARYAAVRFEEETGAVTPLAPEERDAWLEPPAFFEENIQRALNRLDITKSA